MERGLAEYGLVVAGGERRGILTARCSMFTGGRWRPITPLSGPRVDACSAIVEDEDGQPEMWVMGGYDGRNFLAMVEAYNPRTNTWRSCLPLSQRRTGAVAGVVGGRLVVAGGWDGENDFESVEAYTPTGWTPLPPLPHAAYMATACVLNGRLYVMGGFNSNKLQVLEMTEENGLSWSCKADLPAARRNAASAVHEGKIWVMGGEMDGEATASVCVYDPSDDTWAAAPPLPYGIQAHILPALLNSNKEVVLLADARGLLRFDRRRTQWVEDGGRHIDLAPGGPGASPGALLLG